VSNPCNTCDCNAQRPCDTFRADTAPPEADAGADISDDPASATSTPPAARRPGTAARARFAYDLAHINNKRPPRAT
jgi:hypothetical protein